MIPAIILAAGMSSRMNRTKALLPVGSTGDTFLSRVVHTLYDGGVEEIIVVVGKDGERFRAAMPPAATAVRFVENPDPERGQLSSLVTGLNAADRPGVRAVLVTLVDMPLIAADVVRALLETYRRTEAMIVRPAKAGRHGHPVLFDRALFGELRRADPTEGAKAVLRARQNEIVNVEVDGEGSFTDIDTAEEYERLRF
jgi:molybdenum cofactor cytidylyltransferase